VILGSLFQPVNKLITFCQSFTCVCPAGPDGPYTLFSVAEIAFYPVFLNFPLVIIIILNTLLPSVSSYALASFIRPRDIVNFKAGSYKQRT